MASRSRPIDFPRRLTGYLKQNRVHSSRFSRPCIEEHGRFVPTIAPLFEAANAGKFEIVASALTLMEVLVVPYRAGNIELAERYEAVLTRSRGVRMVDLTCGA